ncbi:adenylate kinase isoenzyme 1 isoform X2 [Nilaparvata lugens]|nr:adenylate kinase isoenzyme 1 isoform X2 [Nilaparvata lugens]
MPELDTTVLKEAKLPIIWVLGGPGSGKGTLCNQIVATYGFTHISTGDLLRADVQSGSDRGKALNAIMTKGELVPTNVVLHLLAEKMISLVSSSKGFLIDGYPRELEQGKQFEETISPCDIILYLDANDDVMIARLLKRGQTSGRADDNEETIKKRLNTFHTHNDPIVQNYESKTKKVSP